MGNQYTLQEIRSMTADFRKKLGEGAYAIVYLATWEGTTYAVKQIETRSMVDFRTEFLMLQMANHPCVLKCHGYCFEQGEFAYLVLEYMSRGSLHDQLHQAVLSWDKRVRIARDVASGLHYLHYEMQPPVLHRDVKPANILLDESFAAKLADFGVATTRWEEVFRGTPGYVDPQAQGSGFFTRASDVYSYGVTLLELISGRDCPELLVASATRLQNWEEIVDPRLAGAYDRSELKKLLDVAILCIGEAKQRPSMSAVMEMVNVVAPISNVQTLTVG